jgi:hypothetical protein
MNRVLPKGQQIGGHAHVPQRNHRSQQQYQQAAEKADQDGPVGTLGETEGHAVVRTRAEGERQQSTKQQHIQQLQPVGQEAGEQRVAQQPKLQTIMTRGQQPAQCEWDGQAYNQRCDREIAKSWTGIPGGHGHCHGQAEHEIATGQHRSALREVPDWRGRVSHRQWQSQCGHCCDGDDKIDILQSDEHHQPASELWLQHRHRNANQDQDSDDEIAWSGCNHLGVSYVVGWCTEDQRQADQGERKEWREPDDRNESEDDHCGDEGDPRTHPRSERDLPPRVDTELHALTIP